MFNTVSRFLNGMFRDVQPSVSVPFDLVLALAGRGVALVLVLVTRGRLSYLGSLDWTDPVLFEARLQMP